MKIFPTLVLLLCSSVLAGCSDTDSTATGTATSNAQDSSLPEKTRLATCLTEKGWVMYGSSTCSACLAQRKMFGEAFKHIREIECNPHAPDSEVDLCIAKKIRRTPTWILERDGQEIIRVQDYQLMETLSKESGCD